MKAAYKLLCLAVVALALTACGKKSSSSSTVATTPTANCVWNPQYGQYTIIGTATVCNPNAATTGQCVWNAQYNQYMISGTTTVCNPSSAIGQCVWSPQYNQYVISGTTTVCNPGTTNSYNCTLTAYGYVDANGNLCAPNNYLGSGGACSVYNNRPEYNYAFYVPMYIGSQPYCVRYDLVAQYYYQQLGQQFVYVGQPLVGCEWGSPYCNANYSYYNNPYYGYGGYGQGTCISFGGAKSGKNYGFAGTLGICF